MFLFALLPVRFSRVTGPSTFRYIRRPGTVFGSAFDRGRSYRIFTGFLVLVGFRAGYTALIASGQMAVAYFKVHAPQGFWPINNNGELAVLYCFIFLYIASRGSGRLSVDRTILNRK